MLTWWSTYYLYKNSNAFSVQARNMNAVNMGSHYPQNTVFVQQWGAPPGYAEPTTAHVGQGNPMQYVYSPYNQHQTVHPMQQQLQQSLPMMGPETSSLMTRNLSHAAPANSQQGSAQHPASQKVTTTAQTGQATMNIPYYVQNGGQWPNWPQQNIRPSYSHGSENINVAAVENTAIATAHALTTCTRSEGNPFSLAIVPVGESKKTAQRKNQRLLKKEFQIRSSEWPMKVPATAKGEIHPSCRLHVQKMIRSSARRFLDLSIIKFQDQPPEKLENVKADLEKRFAFDHALKPNFLLEYLETSMRNARYQYHKFWLETGRGSKHEDCPEKIFPALVRHWLTKESEDEIRKQRAEKEEARERMKEARSNHEALSVDNDDEWNVSDSYSCPFPPVCAPHFLQCPSKSHFH